MIDKVRMRSLLAATTLVLATVPFHASHAVEGESHFQAAAAGATLRSEVPLQPHSATRNLPHQHELLLYEGRLLTPTNVVNGPPCGKVIQCDDCTGHPGRCERAWEEGEPDVCGYGDI